MTRYFLLFPAVALLLAACGRDDSPTTATDAGGIDQGAGTLYAYVPADTAAVLGNIDRVPDDILDAWWAQIAPLMPLYAQMADNEDMPEAMRAYFNLLSHFSDRESFEAMGLRADGLAVFYLNGLYPYLRTEFSNRDQLLATLEQFSTEGNIEWQHGEIEGHAYRWLAADGDKPGMPVVAVAVNEDHVAAGWIPRSAAPLGHLVGTVRPTQALRAADLQRFNRDQGYTAYGSGYLDIVRLSELLLDADDPDAQGARAALNMEVLAADPACRTEVAALAAIFPRFDFGLTDMTARHVTVHTRLETVRDMGQRLASLVDLPLGLGSDSGGLFNIGIGLNLVNARNTARHYVDGWVNNPPQCPLFSNLVEDAAEWQVQLNRPIPPVFTNIHGFRALVTELDIRSTSDSVTRDVRGVANLSMSNPQLLMGMAAMFSPELAALDLQPNGVPHAVPAELFQGMINDPAWIAMSDSAIALAIGDGLQTELNAALQPGASDGTLLSYGLDYRAYMDMINGVIADLPEDEATTPDMKALFDVLGNVYERNFFTIRLSEQGIDFTSYSSIKE